MRMFQNLVIFALSIHFMVTLVHGTKDQERKPYIVYLGELADGVDESVIESHHHNLLLEAIGDEAVANASKIHRYGKSFNGFVARLLPHEAETLLGKDSVISVFPNTLRKLHTTRSWDFVGLHENSKRNLHIESNIIVGVLDTGIWMGCPSFNAEGYGPPPSKWKGKCDKGGNFTGCNNKVIGAKYFNLDNANPRNDSSPADTEGHGSHTSSTIAGVAIKDASLYGLAKGTARGGVPSARIAMYKVCWEYGCSDMDILAAFDEAIADGVDIISVSLGGPSYDFLHDPIAIGSFHAMKKNILTSCSGGNDGPYAHTIQNVAPWIFTVAASSIDRKFSTSLKLGNGKHFSGLSVNTFSPKKQMYPLTDGTNAANKSVHSSYGNASACQSWCLSMDKIKGRIVYCLGNFAQDNDIKELQGIGAIMTLDSFEDTAFTTATPGVSVPIKDGKKIAHYINTTKHPQAVIYKTRTVKMDAPFIASFSSRGPNRINRNILKPDIAAPGLDILAGYSKLPSLTLNPKDPRHVVFNVLSGTSMACPHVAAAAAYVKSFHPDWSPAAIKSALMTTATPMKIQGPDAELESGAGQINPTKAVHPGLVYDLSMNSYIRFLCKEGYNATTVSSLIGDKKKHNCSDFKPAEGTDGLNYPTMHTQLLKPNSTISAVFHRTVTLVGKGRSVFKANVVSPKGLFVKVFPSTLKFTELHQQLSFKVLVKGGPMSKGTQVLSALLEWSDSRHSVKSPIVIYRPLM